MQGTWCDDFCFAVIIVAAGSSRRMGFDKLAAKVAGKSVLQCTIEVFAASPKIQQIIVVCPQERWHALNLDAVQIGSHQIISRVDGGEERQHSVQHGLAALHSSIQQVLIHDGARPLLSEIDLNHILDCSVYGSSFALARKVTDTLKRTDENGLVIGGVDREQLWQMETPQSFRVADIRDAYAFIDHQKLSITDDVSALASIGKPVQLLESQFPNLKVTTPQDLLMIEALIHQKKSIT
jgi:2-C-methyl-D-erythritol 4-phosphate cytidylyltransferase